MGSQLKFKRVLGALLLTACSAYKPETAINSVTNSCVSALAAEPGLANRTDILLFEDWEESNWTTNWTEVRVPSNLVRTSAQAFDGTNSLEVRAPQGSHDGGSINFDFSSAGMAQDPEEVFLRYYIRFNESWQRLNDGQIGKLPGFAGQYGSDDAQGCKPANGSNGWSSRMVNRDMGSTHQVGFYVYHADMEESCGDLLYWPQNLARDQWYCVEARIRVNTVTGSRGNNDGILEGWVDDQQVFSRSNFRFTDLASFRVERVWGNFYIGGSWTADRNMSLHLDNLVVSTARIGCKSGEPPPDDPPNGPVDPPPVCI